MMTVTTISCYECILFIHFLLLLNTFTSAEEYISSIICEVFQNHIYPEDEKTSSSSSGRWSGSIPTEWVCMPPPELQPNNNNIDLGGWGTMYDFIDVPPNFMNDNGIISSNNNRNNNNNNNNNGDQYHLIEISSVTIIMNDGSRHGGGHLKINPNANITRIIKEKQQNEEKYSNDDDDDNNNNSNKYLRHRRHRHHHHHQSRGLNEDVIDDELFVATISSRTKTIQHRKKTKGIKTILVIRGIGLDVANTISPDVTTLGNKIFGTDQPTAKTQFHDCSNGLLELFPATGNVNITNGVVEVQVDTNLSGLSRSYAQNLVINKAYEYVGDLLYQYDHVMLSLPREVNFHGVLAYATGGGKNDRWLTVYKNNAALWHSIQMHELGHNLGLDHSDELNAEYSDHTCTMGNPGSSIIMCFNGAKSWFLGWYRNRHKTIYPLKLLESSGWTGKLVGIDDYINDYTIKDEHYVIIKIEVPYYRKSEIDEIYIMFNRKKGINRGVQEFANLVTIVQGTNDKSYSYRSNLLAGLGDGTTTNNNHEYKILNFLSERHHLVIDVTNIVIGGGLLDYAEVHISIEIENCITDNDCNNIMFNECNTGICNNGGKCIPNCSSSSSSPTIPPTTSPTIIPPPPTTQPPSTSSSPQPSTTPTINMSSSQFPSQFPSISISSSSSVQPSTTTIIPSQSSSIPTTTITSFDYYTEIFFESFENGFGTNFFTNGGEDATINTKYGHTGTSSLRLQDDSSSSNAYTTIYNVTTYSTIRIDFWFMSLRVEDGESFVLELKKSSSSSSSSNNNNNNKNNTKEEEEGSNSHWIIIQSWVKGINFENDEHIWNAVTLDIDTSNINNLQIRFRCNASGNNDRIFIDDVKMSGVV